MKQMAFFCCILLSFYSNILFAQTYTPADNGSSIRFVIKNFGFNVEGSFKNLQGSMNFDPDNLKTSVFNVTVDAATVTTGNNSRDIHLKKEEYFDVIKYPKILFATDKIEKTASGGYIATGKFTVKGKNKPVSIPFTAILQSDGYLFKGKLILNRRDFGVGGDSFVLSDNLTLAIIVFARKAKN